MKYINASDLLPPALVQTLQEYVQGGYVYIPAREHKGWGEKSGSREALAQRNEEIRSRKQAGATLEALAETYHLSVSAIRKSFIRKRNKKSRVKQLPLKKTLIFLFLDFLRGSATAVFIRKHNK